MKDPKEVDYFKAWLLFFLITTLGGGTLGLIIGSFLAAFLSAGGTPLIMFAFVEEKHLLVAVFVVAMPISYVTFRAVVGKYLFPKIEDDTPPKV
jgi:hypothetical protein